MTAEILLYCTTWCGGCYRAQHLFDEQGVAYTYIDIDKDSTSAEFVMQTNGGNRSVPTIVFPDGSILVEPNQIELAEKVEALSKGNSNP